MRKLALLVLPVLCCGVGCVLDGNGTHCGYYAGFIRPATIDTRMPVIVQGGQGPTTAHPLGSVAGPVQSGDWTHAPMAPIVPQPMPRAGASVSYGGACEPQCGPPRLTIQEWKDCAESINGRPLPQTPTKNTQ